MATRGLSPGILVLLLSLVLSGCGRGGAPAAPPPDRAQATVTTLGAGVGWVPQTDMRPVLDTFLGNMPEG